MITFFTLYFSLEDTWAKYKSALDSAAREVLGSRLSARKPYGFLRPLSVLSINGGKPSKGDIEEYRRLAGPRRRSLRHDKNQWVEQVACAGENHLLCGEIKDAFANFRQLRQKYVTLSAPLKKKKMYCPSCSEVDLSRLFSSRVKLNCV